VVDLTEVCRYRDYYLRAFDCRGELNKESNLCNPDSRATRGFGLLFIWA